MYNFVIFGYSWDLYKISYSDVIGSENVRYIPNYEPTNNKLLNLLFKTHFSEKINKIVKLPFKNWWYKSYFKNDFNTERPLCFFFFGRQLVLQKYGYVDFLKSKYPNAKFVCFFQDLIAQHDVNNIPYLKTVFDLLISFDHKEANQYNIEYFSLVNSKATYDLSSPIHESDIFFVGAAKNRYDQIIAAYELLKAKKLKCDFHIVGVKKKHQKYRDEIHYINDMSYLENLKHIVKTKCILEIMQKNGHGFTQRMMDAIVYDKKIITNNQQVSTASFYNPSNILVFKDLVDLDRETSFFENFDRTANHNYKDEISPRKLLELVTEKLNV